MDGPSLDRIAGDAKTPPVTTWGVQQVGQWASAAGWKGDDLAYAVAVAMAGSNGADHAKVNPSYDVQLERRGLWLVRLLDMDEPQNVDLFDPVQNAAFAHTAWLERGQQWQWHPVALSGAADDALDYVREALQPNNRKTLGSNPSSFAVKVDILNRRVNALRSAAPSRRRFRA